MHVKSKENIIKSDVNFELEFFIISLGLFDLYFSRL